MPQIRMRGTWGREYMLTGGRRIPESRVRGRVVEGARWDSTDNYNHPHVVSHIILCSLNSVLDSFFILYIVLYYCFSFANLIFSK